MDVTGYISNVVLLYMLMHLEMSQYILMHMDPFVINASGESRWLMWRNPTTLSTMSTVYSSNSPWKSFQLPIISMTQMFQPTALPLPGREGCAGVCLSMAGEHAG